MQFEIKNGEVLLGNYTTQKEQPIPINGDIIKLPVARETPEEYRTYEVIGRIFTYFIPSPIPRITISVKKFQNYENTL